MLISQSYVKRGFVNFWVILGDVWEEIVFLKGLVKFGEIRNISNLKLVDGHPNSPPIT